MAKTPKPISPVEWSSQDCGAALARLLTVTLTHEAEITARDQEIEKIEKRYDPKIEKAAAEIGLLEEQIEEYYMAHLEEIEGGGRKSVQYSAGLIGRRLPPSPGLVPLSEKWSWEKIVRRVKRAWKERFFHPPKPATLDKVKLKRELSPEQLSKVGLKLEDTETFYIELNRLKEAA
ncbi:MAG: host-nuclease inhibitor Gam family protein [Acidobacteria bacterium]|nr:host-nuclease inhibitor Gam family protein [Acidobacteriota bacterium]